MHYFVTLQSNWKYMQEIVHMTDYKLSLRDRILDTAISAMVKRGVKAVKMDDVAAALGISKRTLYEIYDTKETVVYEGIKRFHRLKDEELVSYARDANHNVLDIIIFLYRQHMKDSGTIPITFYEDIMKYPMIVAYLDERKQLQQQNLLQFLQRGVDEGFFRRDINYRLVLHLFEALGSYLHQTHLYEQYSFEELFFNMLFVTLRGCCTSKGIEKLDKFFEENRRG